MSAEPSTTAQPLRAWSDGMRIATRTSSPQQTLGFAPLTAVSFPVLLWDGPFPGASDR